MTCLASIIAGFALGVVATGMLFAWRCAVDERRLYQRMKGLPKL